MPTRARHRRLDELAEAQNHTALTFIDDIKAAGNPHQDDQPDQETGATADHAGARPAAAGRLATTGTATLAAQKPVEFTVQVAPDFVEIGGALVTTVIWLASPLRIIQGQQWCQYPGKTIFETVAERP